MSATNNGGPAFALSHPYYGPGIRVNVREGMSLRDWFAGRALQGILAQPLDSSCSFNPKLCAESSYEYADAMLTARKEQP